MKSSLKTILLSACATVATFVSMMYVSCSQDKCKSVVCANNGVCSNGACICVAGYEGPNCETVARNKWIGNWTVNEKGSTTAAAQYTASIEEGANVTDVSIVNFYNFFQTPIKGYIANDTLYIPNQQLQGHVVFGKGYLYTTTTYGQYGAISLIYEVVDTATNIPDDFGYYSLDGSLPATWTR